MQNLKNIENKVCPSGVIAEAGLTRKLMDLTLAKGEDPRKLKRNGS